MWGGNLHSSWSLGFHALDYTKFYRQLVKLYYTSAFFQERGAGKHWRRKTHFELFQRFHLGGIAAIPGLSLVRS